jgi:hypothetical protein
VASWNAWRLAEPHDRPDLSYLDAAEAKLSGIDFSGTVLREANLIGADLNGADLSGSDLSGALLCKANLDHAELLRTDLRGANLAEAVLEHANLRGALFDRTYLSDSRWRNAKLAFTIFADVDLSNVIDLNRVEHVAPSRIGIDTVLRFSGQFPEGFLSRAGLPPSLISALPEVVKAQEGRRRSIFVSYSHEDRPFVDLLVASIDQNFWYDKKRLLPGQEILEVVAREISLSDKVILCCSRHALLSDYVSYELDQALRAERSRHLQKGVFAPVLVPIDLDGYLLHWRDQRRSELTQRYCGDFKGWRDSSKDFKGEFEKLTRILAG